MATRVPQLFGFSSRLGQRFYWMYAGIIVGLRVAGAIVLAVEPAWTWAAKTDFLLIFLALIVGRRMADFGMSRWIGILAVALISLVIPVAAVILWPPAGPITYDNLLPWWLGLLIFALLLALLVAVGLKQGDPGPNRYGEVPIDSFKAKASASP